MNNKEDIIDIEFKDDIEEMKALYINLSIKYSSIKKGYKNNLERLNRAYININKLENINNKLIKEIDKLQDYIKNLEY